MVFQDPYSSLNPRQTVGQIIGAPFHIHKTEGSTKRKVQDLMNRVGLNPEHYNRYPHEFSGGQRQRIGVARALALSPKLIVCDEPVSALDVSIQAQILNLLLSLQRDFDLTYLFISHDLGVVRHVSDRIAVMYLGRIVEMGDADEVYGNPKHPYTAALLSAVPQEEARRGRPARTGSCSPETSRRRSTRRPAAPSTRAARRRGSSRGTPSRCPRACRTDIPELATVERGSRGRRAGTRCSPATTSSVPAGRDARPLGAQSLRLAAILESCPSSRRSSRTTSERSTTPPGWRRRRRSARQGNGDSPRATSTDALRASALGEAGSRRS